MSDLVKRLREGSWGIDAATDEECMNKMNDLSEEAAAALTLANARIARLGEALRPFGDLCDEIETSSAEYDETDSARNPENWSMQCSWEDLRRARAALKGDA